MANSENPEKLQERKRISDAQKEYVADFMEKNYNFLYGKFKGCDGNKKKTKKWNELVEELNKIGPAKKTLEQWQRVRITI